MDIMFMRQQAGQL